MYEVLFIDDEPLALEGLKDIIEWENFGFHVLDVCNNGEDAIKSVKQCTPDLIITDICMPVMDGLDFIEHTKADVSNNIEFIILTGYSEFPYAKRAMKYGIKYFLLKPLFRDELEKIVCDIKLDLDKKNAAKTESNDNETTIISEILARTIYGSSDDDDFFILEKYKNKSSGIKAWCYVKVMLESIDCINASPKFSNNMLDEVFLDNPLFVVEKNPEFLGMIIGFSKNEKTIIQNFIENLKHNLENLQYKIHSIIVGDVVPDITDFINSYISTVQTTTYTFFAKNKDLIYYSDFKNEILNYMPYNIDYTRLIIEALEDVDIAKAKTVIDEIFSSFSNELIAPEIIMMFTVNVIYRAISIVNNLGGDTEALKINYLSLLKKKQYLCISSLKNMLFDFCIKCCKIIEKVRKHNYQDITLKIEELLKDNYKKNVKIKEISHQLHMNPAYLGQLFNKKFGMSFNEYINKMRVMEAKRLIDSSSMKMYEIAEAVGYKDYKGFFQQFEKITGMKPQEYKNLQNR
jgi:two-component system response regulator YesN